MFIKNIQLKRLRNFPELEINLNPDKMQHLIITGPNGCGKSTFVKELTKSLSPRPTYLTEVVTEINNNFSGDILHYISLGRDTPNWRGLERCVDRAVDQMNVFPDISRKAEFYVRKDMKHFLVYSSEAHRQTKFKRPSGPQAIPERTTGEQFIQLLVNMETQLAYTYMDKNELKNEEEREKAEIEHAKMQRWFEKVTQAIADLFGHTNFNLKYDRLNYNYFIEEEGKERYDFTQLSDGYSSVLRIVTDMMLQMTTAPVEAYNLEGVAIIDEIETHLHVALQRQILPFLTAFFPNVQFIVTTHSPFVLSSIKNAVIYDMRKRERFEDFSQYSYSNIIEDYFNTSLYSKTLLDDLAKVRDILQKEEWNEEEKGMLVDFDRKVSALDKSQPAELINAWLELKLMNYDRLHDLLS